MYEYLLSIIPSFWNVTVLSQMIHMTNLLAKAYLENPHEWQNIMICAFGC